MFIHINEDRIDWDDMSLNQAAVIVLSRSPDLAAQVMSAVRDGGCEYTAPISTVYHPDEDIQELAVTVKVGEILDGPYTAQLISAMRRVLQDSSC